MSAFLLSYFPHFSSSWVNFSADFFVFSEIFCIFAVVMIFATQRARALSNQIRINERDMKKLLLLFGCLTTLMMYAQTAEELKTLVVSLTDGTVFRFDIPTKEPMLQFSKGVVKVYSIQDVGEESNTLTIARDHLKDIFFEDAETAIQTSTTERNAVTFNLLQPSTIAVNGLRSGDQIQVVGIDGRCEMNVSAAANGQAVVDLSGRSRGIYVISVNKRFNFKYRKP